MSGFGPNADSFCNVQATPGAEVIIESRRFFAAHREHGGRLFLRRLGAVRKPCESPPSSPRAQLVEDG